MIAEFAGDGRTNCENPKFEARNSKQILMTKNRNSKPYDLEDRTLAYAKRMRAFVKKLPSVMSSL